MSEATPFFPVRAGDRSLPGPPQAWQVRPYPQLLRGPNHAWWRPLASTALVLLWIGGLVIVFGLTMVVALAVSGDLTSDGQPTDAEVAAWGVSPFGLLVTNVLLALCILVAQSAVWGGHGWRPRWVASVAGGIRWTWLIRCFLASTLALLVVNAVLVVVDGGIGPIGLQANAGLYALIVLTTTPLQAAGEEYLFRGWLTQAIGSWFAGPVLGAVVAALVSASLFALAHGSQNSWLFADRFMFALVASWLVWRTGGLEASIALHAVYNLLSFAVALLTGQLDDMILATEADGLLVVLDLVSMLVAAGVLAWLAKRSGIVSRFRPPGVS